jgi:cytochrome c5
VVAEMPGFLRQYYTRRKFYLSAPQNCSTLNLELKKFLSDCGFWLGLEGEEVMKAKKTMLIFMGLILLLVLAACASATPIATVAPIVVNSTSPAVLAPTSVPATIAPVAGLDGKTLLEQRCTVCHSLDRVQAKKLDASGWSTIVQRMVGKGAELNAAEQKILIDYLAKTYGQ